MTENERAMYTGMAISRNTEVTLRWSRSQMFIVINVGGFSFLATRTPAMGFYLALGIVGIIVGVVWVYSNWRAQQWVEYWNSRLAAVEDTEPNPVAVHVFKGSDWDQADAKYGFHHILMTLAAIFTLLWFAVVVVAFTK